MHRACRDQLLPNNVPGYGTQSTKRFKNYLGMMYFILSTSAHIHSLLHTRTMSQSCSCEDFGSADNVPLAYGPPVPYHATTIPEAESEDRVKMPNKDFCSVDNHGFYLRGQLLVPITDASDEEEQYFSWNVWVSQSEANYVKALNEMNKQGREKSDPTFGYVSTELRQVYKVSTYNLPAMVTTQPVGRVPRFELEPASEHPLAVEQRNGISMDRVREIASILLSLIHI